MGFYTKCIYTKTKQAEVPSQKPPKLKLHQSLDFLRCRCIWTMFYQSLLEAAAAVMCFLHNRCFNLLQRGKSSRWNALQSPKQYFMPPTIVYSLLLFPEEHPCLLICYMQAEGETACTLSVKRIFRYLKNTKKERITRVFYITRYFLEAIGGNNKNT